VLLKLDLTRAFDSLSWSFLFDVLHHLGFLALVLQWLSIPFRTASTKVCVNGVSGKKIVHARGLRQGDPLSPLLFVLAMEVATLLIKRAVEYGLLAPIGNCTTTQRISIYADDIVLFVKPEVQDLVMVRNILEVFGEASGLHVNYRKTSTTLIRGSEHHEHLVQGLFHCELASFPIRYLGLQLALRPLTKAQWQPMLDAAVHIVPAWQKGLIARPGHLTLIQSVMTACSVHHLLIAKAPCWLLE
jgi:hypothetical protein